MLRNMSEITVTSLAYPSLINMIIWYMFNINFLPVIRELKKRRNFLLTWLIIKMQGWTFLMLYRLQFVLAAVITALRNKLSIH